MINTNKLKERIAEMGMTQGDIAKAMNLAAPTISQKLNGVRSMSLKDAEKLSRILKIGSEEFGDYFFS